MENNSYEKIISIIFKDILSNKNINNFQNKTKTRAGTNKKYEIINRYLKYQQELIDKCINNNHLEYLYNLYYNNYCINKNNIINKTSEEKEEIIDNQKLSIKKWLDLFILNNNYYPMWFKYIMFQSIIKIGSINNIGDSYKKRDKNTTCCFIECNKEIVDSIYKDINNYLNDNIDINKYEIIKQGLIDKLYISYLKEYRNKNISKLSNKGIWVKYNRNSKEDAISLYRSLKNKDTRWCTSTGIVSAMHQICGGRNYKGGDFYVYYTLDNNNTYTIPRIAIRMDGVGVIGEVRGLLENQNVESSLLNILEDKITSLNISYKEKKNNLLKLNNINKLLLIENKINNNEILSIDEIIFVYDTNDTKYKFGILNQNKLIQLREKISKINFYKDVFLNNKEFILKLLNDTGIEIKYISDNLKDDLDIALIAINKDSSNFQYMSSNLKRNNKILNIALKSNPYLLEFTDYEFRNDKKLILKCVNINGISLKYASNNLKDDKEVVYYAFLNNFRALKHASDNLKKDKDFMLDLIKINFHAFEFLIDDLINDKELIFEAVKQDPRIIYLSKKRYPIIFLYIYSLFYKVKNICLNNNIIDILKYDIKLNKDSNLIKKDYKRYTK